MYCVLFLLPSLSLDRYAPPPTTPRSERNGPIGCYRIVLIRLPTGGVDLPSSPSDLNITNYSNVHGSAPSFSASLSSSSAYALNPAPPSTGSAADTHDGITNQIIGAYVADEFSTDASAIGKDVIIGDEQNSLPRCDTRDELAGRALSTHSLTPRRTNYPTGASGSNAAAAANVDMSASRARERVFDGLLAPKTNYRYVYYGRHSIARARTYSKAACCPQKTARAVRRTTP